MIIIIEVINTLYSDTSDRNCQEYKSAKLHKSNIFSAYTKQTYEVTPKISTP